MRTILVERDELVKSIVDNLGMLIGRALNALAEEQWNPQSDADKRGERIRDNVQRAVQLRALREKFENIMSGISES